MRARGALSLVCLGLLACGRRVRDEPHPVEQELRTAPGPRDPATFPLRMHYRYVDDEDDRGKRRTATWEVTCEALADAPAAEPEFDCRTVDLSGVAKPTRRRVARRRDGWMQLSMTVGPRHTPFDPPRLFFPAVPQIGKAWVRDAAVRGVTIHEESRIVAADACAGGVVVESTDVYSNGSKLVIATRYCPGVGVAGSVLDAFEDGVPVSHSDHHDFVDVK